MMIPFNSTKGTPRDTWPSGQPFLVAEAFYAVGVLISVVRLNNLLQVHSSLGPLQISLATMVRDVIRFAIIFFIMLSAFVLAITKLYSSYEGSVRIVDGEEAGKQQDMFFR